jgi:putative membrane protein
LRADPAFRPDAAALHSVRRAPWAEVALFAAIPVAAAAMARAYGM